MAELYTDDEYVSSTDEHSRYEPTEEDFEDMAEHDAIMNLERLCLGNSTGGEPKWSPSFFGRSKLSRP